MRMRGMIVVLFGMLPVSCVGTKKLRINTQPTGAQITVNGVQQPGLSNMEIEVSQRHSLGIVATKSGYETAAYTVQTRPNRWLGLLWTRDDPRARIIPEDEVTLTLRRIPTAEHYTPAELPPFNPPQEMADFERESSAPSDRETGDRAAH